jgi:hypothetical protein
MTETLTTITIAPLLPWPVLAALAIASAVLVAVGLWRRAQGIWWRTLGLAAALGALANPSLVEELHSLLPDIVIVAIDESASQGIGERRGQTAEARAALAERLAAIANLEVRMVSVGDRAGPQDAPETGTLLFEALRGALGDLPARRIAGVVAITDGQIHDSPGEVGLELDAPLHVLLTGEPDETDRRLVIERAPRYGIVGDTLSLALSVEDAGTPRPGEFARVTMRIGDAPAETTLLPIGETVELEFNLDRAGITVIEIEVESGADELSELNNRVVVEVNGVRDRLRVLLVSGEAHTGERVWRNLLKADPSVDLVHFTILRPPEKQDATPIRELALISFPIRELFEIKLGEFDLIIFDRYRRRGVVPLSYLGNIASFVEQGGALLTAAGPAFATPLSLFRSPLKDVLPARPTGDVFTGGFRATLTDIGRRHPVTGRLPGAEGDTPTWGRWFRQIDVEADRGMILMEGMRGRPILVLDRVGEGRVAQLLTDHMWLWARGFEGGGPQAEILRRLAHWLMKEPDLEEETLSAVARGNRIEITRRSLGEITAPVEVVSPSGETQSVTLEDDGEGRGHATITVEEPGLYRLSDGAETAVAAVGEVNPAEYADLRASPDVLAPLADATGGSVSWLSEDGTPSVRMVGAGRDTAGRGWIGLRANKDYVVTGIAQAALMPEWVVLLLTLGGLMLAWRAEGR